MYSFQLGSYVYWVGNDWSESTIDFDESLQTNVNEYFNYGKYLSTWNIQPPNIVVIMLGTNDFYHKADDATITNYLNNFEIFKTKINEYNPDIKICLCTPCQAASSGNSECPMSPHLKHLNYWKARKAINNNLNDYDTLYNTYVIDSGICFDPDYGFPQESRLPFAQYTGNETELYDTNGVHPSSEGYKQIGTSVAAYIQAIRLNKI